MTTPPTPEHEAAEAIREAWAEAEAITTATQRACATMEDAGVIPAGDADLVASIFASAVLACRERARQERGEAVEEAQRAARGGPASEN